MCCPPIVRRLQKQGVVSYKYHRVLFLNIGKIVVETKEERKAAGKPVGHDVPYIAMGGITGFSSLIDGSQRLDPSGVGDSIGNMYRALE